MHTLAFGGILASCEKQKTAVEEDCFCCTCTAFPIHEAGPDCQLVSQEVCQCRIEVEMVNGSCLWEGQKGSRTRVPHRGSAVGLAPALAAEHAAERGCSAGLLQVHQVVVGLAHPRLLALVTPPEEELGALLEEAACGVEDKGR